MLKEFQQRHHCTLVGVGPMSKNCVDVTIEISNTYNIPIMLIASRRQIEASCFGNGYVNNWSTEEFAAYVKSHDKNHNIVLSRDHGGLWQNNFELGLNLHEAMKTAKKSFQIDIESGFDLIHIDVNTNPYKSITVNENIKKIFEFYKFCVILARKNNKKIIFEIGNEEQNGTIYNIFDMEKIISETIIFCKDNFYPLPTFAVIPTGTKVMETKNIGNFVNLTNYSSITDKVNLCNKYNILLKEHNADYLPNRILSMHPSLGIHSANIAPEFGVTETKTFLSLLLRYNLISLYEKFINLSYNSKKWEKWMLPDTTASDIDKSIIAGHYVFATPEFVEIKSEALKYIPNLDDYLKTAIRLSIMRYLINFRMI